MWAGREKIRAPPHGETAPHSLRRATPEPISLHWVGNGYWIAVCHGEAPPLCYGGRAELLRRSFSAGKRKSISEWICFFFW